MQYLRDPSAIVTHPSTGAEVGRYELCAPYKYSYKIIFLSNVMFYAGKCLYRVHMLQSGWSHFGQPYTVSATATL